MLRVVLLCVSLSCLSGCYYVQAAQGQWELTRKREPIAELLEDEATPAELARRLRLVRDARRFAIDELGLPDNDTYTTYADIERDYVLWNVFAAPEFSLQPKTWCFPVAGCVSYRGYFSRDDARRKAARLARRGYDVAVGGAAAYSTLGKLNDPVLSTMLQWDDTQLVAVLFHELAHQVLYVKGDSGFNESFATAVEEVGVRRWLAARGLHDERRAYDTGRESRQALMELVADARRDLERLYGEAIDDAPKRERKRRRLAALAQDAAALLESRSRDPGAWRDQELNNARLASMTLYEGRLPEFRALLAACEGALPCFYAEARRLAGR